jgi:hypothetical protein
MANRLFIAEYADIAETVRGTAQAPKDPCITEQVVTIGAGSVLSAPFDPATRFILITTDTICSVLVGGLNPVATTSSHRMAADQAEFRGVFPGDKLAVISNT